MARGWEAAAAFLWATAGLPLASGAHAQTARDLVGCYQLRWTPDVPAPAYSQAGIVDEDRVSVLRLGAAPYGRPAGQRGLRVEAAPRRRRSFPHVFWRPETDSTFVVYWMDTTLFGGVRAELMVKEDSVQGRQYTFSDGSADREPWDVRGARVSCAS